MPNTKELKWAQRGRLVPVDPNGLPKGSEKLWMSGGWTGSASKGRPQWSRLDENTEIYWDTLHEASIRGKRSLLFIHGTGMGTKESLAVVPCAEWLSLYEAYGQRIIGFDHPTVYSTSRANARWLAKVFAAVAARRGGSFELKLDILCVSRGGLIARELTEGWVRPETFGQSKVSVRKVVFVGTPNDGTPAAGRMKRKGRSGLAKKNLTQIWFNQIRRVVVTAPSDRETPEVADPRTLEPFPASRTLTRRRLNDKRGANEQLPNSGVIKRLNGRSGEKGKISLRTTEYFAVASDLRLDGTKGNANIKNHLYKGERFRRSAVLNLLFRGCANDLVVPTASVFAPQLGPHCVGRGARRFPIKDDRLMVLAPAAAVSHTGYLRAKRVRERLWTWLDGEGTA